MVSRVSAWAAITIHRLIRVSSYDLQVSSLAYRFHAFCLLTALWGTEGIKISVMNPLFIGSFGTVEIIIIALIMVLFIWLPYHLLCKLIDRWKQK